MQPGGATEFGDSTGRKLPNGRSAAKNRQSELHYQPITAILYTTRMGTVTSAIQAESV